MDSDLSGTGLNPDLYDEEDYGRLEAVADWALKQMRDSDDSELIERANEVMLQTKGYLETEYDLRGFKIGGGSLIDFDEAYDIVEDARIERAHGDFESWDYLADVCYELEKIREYKQD